MKRKKNNRIGCRGGNYLLPVSFRNPTFTPAFVEQVQEMYAQGFYTQFELYQIFAQDGCSLGMINKMCRIAPENVEKAKSKRAMLKLRRARA